MPRKVRSKSNKPKKPKKSKISKVGVKSNSRRFLVEYKNNNGSKKKSQVYKKGRFRVSVPVSNKTNNNSKLVSNQNLGRTPVKNSIIHKRRQPYKKTLFNNNRPVNNTKNSTKSNSNVKSVNNKHSHCLQKSELTKRQLEIKKHILKLIKELAGDMTYENRIEMELENTAPFRITPMEITFNPEYKELWEGGDDDIVKAKMEYGFEVTKEEEKCLKKLFVKRRKSKKVKKMLKKPLAKGKKSNKKSKKKSNKK